MLTIAIGSTIIIVTTIVEKRARNNGNTDAALSAKRFNGYFIGGLTLTALYYVFKAAGHFVQTMFFPF